MSGTAAQALASLDVTLDAVRAEVALIVGEGDEATTGQIPFTPRAKKVLEFGLREALSLSDNYVGTEHLLLGLTRVDGVAGQILAELGLDGERIRNEVIRLLFGGRPRRRVVAAVPGVPSERVAHEYDVKTLDGASDTWADQLGEWRRDGWELLSVVQDGGAVRAILERRRRNTLT